MRTTILPMAIILTKAHRAAVSKMAKECICGLSTASEVFLIFTTQIYQYFSDSPRPPPFSLFSDEPEVFLPKYFQTAILHADAAHFRGVLNAWLLLRTFIEASVIHRPFLSPAMTATW